MKILRAPDRAEDAAQEAMLRAHRARDSWTGTGEFDAWLHRIARNVAINHLRRRAHRASPGEDTFVPSVPSNDPPPDDMVAAGQLAACLDGCMGNLREDDRVAFEERFLRGTTERDLGRLLGVSTAAAKQRAFRARRAVRECVLARYGAATPAD